MPGHRSACCLHDPARRGMQCLLPSPYADPVGGESDVTSVLQIRRQGSRGKVTSPGTLHSRKQGTTEGCAQLYSLREAELCVGPGNQWQWGGGGLPAV